ncbi:MAG: class I SAM-dependent methyltransferase, partial [Methylobacterium sp.]|nr:class I SAM-dependent methyltransferase [Methylobacterium sp.]
MGCSGVGKHVASIQAISFPASTGSNLPYRLDILVNASFPIPDPDQRAHSAALVSAICREIEAQDGWISFARYMALALYAPGLGYYSAGAQKFGAGGDFVTAPEMSALFGRCLAFQVEEVLGRTGGDLLELGAGSGRLAVDLLLELQRHDRLPQQYFILEVSASLRDMQRGKLAVLLPPELFRRVAWLETLPQTFTGVIVGNEVLDALPVHLLAWREEGILERGLSWEEGLAWRERPLPPGPLLDSAMALALPPGYVSELCPAAAGLIASLSDCLLRGAILFIDYGFPRREYYHPQRTSGTLMCHYRHHAHDDPLAYPGLQDLTAHVDFTAAAEAAQAARLEVLGYTSQAQFLINCGITDLLAAITPADPAAYLPAVAQVQKLLSPAEMGELFKV